MRRWRENLTRVGTKITVCLNGYTWQGHIVAFGSTRIRWCSREEYAHGQAMWRVWCGAGAGWPLSRAEMGHTWCFGWDTDEAKALAVAGALADDGLMLSGSGNFTSHPGPYQFLPSQLPMPPATTTTLIQPPVSATSPAPPSTPLPTNDL